MRCASVEDIGCASHALSAGMQSIGGEKGLGKDVVGVTWLKKGEGNAV